jgi:hypothetical protein
MALTKVSEDMVAFAVGGGGGIGKTVTVGDYNFPNAQDIDLWAKERYTVYSTNVGGTSHKLFTPNSSFPSSYEASTVTNDTYVTVANITSAANGGGIYFLSGQNNNYANNTSTGGTFKITIDGGTPKEYSFYSASSPYGYFNYIGKAITAYAGYSNSTSGFNQIGKLNILQDGTPDGSWHQNYDATSGTFYNGVTWRDVVHGLAYTAEESAQMGLPYVYFTSSCLVEYKAVSASNVKAYAQILTF